MDKAILPSSMAWKEGICISFTIVTVFWRGHWSGEGTFYRGIKGQSVCHSVQHDLMAKCHVLIRTMSAQPIVIISVIIWIGVILLVKVFLLLKVHSLLFFVNNQKL